MVRMKIEEIYVDDYCYVNFPRFTKGKCFF